MNKLKAYVRSASSLLAPSTLLKLTLLVGWMPGLSLAQTCTGGAASCGTWSQICDWGNQINPGGCPIGTNYTEVSHAALIPISHHAGKVLQWRQSLNPSTCAMTDTTEVWVFNPNNPGVLEIVNQTLSSDIFCSAAGWDRNGRLLVAGGFLHSGGTPGAIQAFRFDPRLLGLVLTPVGGGTPVIQGPPWSSAFDMSLKHYYPTLIGLDRRQIDSTGQACQGFSVPGGSQALLGGPPVDGSTIGTEIWQFADPAINPSTGNPWLHSLDSASGGTQTATGPVEIYSVAQTTPATWPLLDSYPRAFQLANPLTPIGTELHGRIFVASDVETDTSSTGVQPNPPGESWVMKPPAANSTTGCWEIIRGDNSEPLARERHYAPAILMQTLARRNRILFFGGSHPPAGGGTPWVSHGFVQEYDFQGTSPEGGSWRDKTPLLFARLFNNAVVTPIGYVLIIGGETIDTQHGGTYTGCGSAVFTPEFYDPGMFPLDAGVSYPLAPEPTSTPRRYHSVAALLLDGSVVIMGGHQRNTAPPCPPSEHTGQVYQPPYMHNGTRPVIESAPGTINFVAGGSSFQVDATLYYDHVEKVVLLRPAAVTHHQDNDQRYIELEFSAPSYEPGDSVTLTVNPPDETLGPPGYYTLWVVESKTSSSSPSYTDLVPSIAKVIRLL